MPPKKQQDQSTLNLPRNRRNIKKQPQHHKSINDESIIQIGKQLQANVTTDATNKKHESKLVLL